MKLHVAPRIALTGVADHASATETPPRAIGDAEHPARNNEPNA